ncbi:helix-turn-helix domain-containing protein [Arthrobacter sp. ISL-69]|uniref:helix-turn-helix domain-containing protein n=1 Tax=Arthrobacter sp. ISL-69 TaxID=2819113 RepID=UPI001BEAA296|nr:helix-turn-helix domain-containing protein [Arthrobacter sp. ISL-69]MBT2536247.1 helix-turn-helix domain-containing protein [Arthrobacter sp. ISL-69]
MVSVPGVPCRPLQYLTAVARSDLSSGTKATCWALASFVNTKTGEAFPSVATLAKAVGLSSPTVSQHTKRAEAAGYLHKHVRRNNSILYTITIPITDDMITNLDAGTSSGVPTPGEGYAGVDEQSNPLGQ